LQAGSERAKARLAEARAYFNWAVPGFQVKTFLAINRGLYLVFRASFQFDSADGFGYCMAGVRDFVFQEPVTAKRKKPPVFIVKNEKGMNSNG
jgi:hypothetical protein